MHFWSSVLELLSSTGKVCAYAIAAQKHSTLSKIDVAKFTRNFTRRVGLPMYTLRPLRRVRLAHSDQIRRCSQWTRTVRVGLALQCECSSGRVGYGSDAPSAD